MIKRVLFVIIFTGLCCLNAYGMQHAQSTPELTAATPLPQRDSSLGELDIVTMIGGRFEERPTDETWRADARERVGRVLALVQPIMERAGGSLPPTMGEHLVSMLERERNSGKLAYYHGASGQWAVYLALNKLLYERKTGKTLPVDMQLLRRPGTRQQLEGMSARHYRLLSEFLGDNLNPSQEELLSVGYTPFDGVSDISCGPLPFMARNFSYGRKHFCDFIEQLLCSYGYQIDRMNIVNALDFFKPRYGLMLQVLVAISAFEHVVYLSCDL